MRVLSFAPIIGLVLSIPQAAPAAPFMGMIELTVRGEQIEGRPLAWDSQHVFLLQRDGVLRQFRTSEAANFKKSSDRFRPATISQLRSDLLRDLGKEYSVGGTGHYLVAHRRGQYKKWDQRFEDLYRSFTHYFSVRGHQITEPPFPLIGIVCKDRNDFQRYVARRGGSADNTLGCYFPDSNRIVLYDVGGAENSKRWEETAATIIHEATHQTAFNTGIHNRYTPPPAWVVEGLATMFEAPGVYDSRHYIHQKDRIHRGELASFRKVVLPNHGPESLKQMVVSDARFRSSPASAYAEAWAFTFYLVESRPRDYAAYLVCTNSREPFTAYTAAARKADFEAVFGSDWQMLQVRFVRFMARLN